MMPPAVPALKLSIKKPTDGARFHDQLARREAARLALFGLTIARLSGEHCMPDPDQTKSVLPLVTM